jgi:CPA1 family monovalent cation:H+ antiporter
MDATATLLGLLLAALLIAVAAKRLDLPYPIALVLAGSALAFLPEFSAFHLDPEIVFYILLPPILFEAAYFTSWRDFWRWRRPILLLAFGLTAATSAAVAALCVYFIPGMNWATGFVLGAIVSPPDAAAATAITRGLRLPRRIVQILEGESLVNDAAGLTLYRFAVAATVSGAFSLSEAALSFLWIAIAGTVIGCALGLAYVRLYPRIKHPEVELISTFLLGYLSYAAAESVHASGVLATVASGLILGWHSPELFTAMTRIRGVAVWQTALFLVNAFVFTAIGLQMPGILRSLSGYPAGALLLWSVIISLGVILTRLAWVFPAAYLPRWLSARIREREPDPTLRAVTVVGWTGLRGVVSLAAAFALPLETNSGLPFPYRSLLLLLTLAVIAATLLLQGLTLRPLICFLRVPEDRSSEEEELHARIHAAEQVLEHLAHAESRNAAPAPILERVRGYYEDRLAEFRSRLAEESGGSPPDRPGEFASLAEQRLWWEAARVERNAILALRRSQSLGDEALHQIERDLDLLEARLIPR